MTDLQASIAATMTMGASVFGLSVALAWLWSVLIGFIDPNHD